MVRRPKHSRVARELKKNDAGKRKLSGNDKKALHDIRILLGGSDSVTCDSCGRELKFELPLRLLFIGCYCGSMSYTYHGLSGEALELALRIRGDCGQ